MARLLIFSLCCVVFSQADLKVRLYVASAQQPAPPTAAGKPEGVPLPQPGPEGVPQPVRPAPADGASIRGSVVAASNGAALPRARVELFARGRRITNTLTDERGRFVLAVSDDAPLTLTVAKAGHAALSMELPRAAPSGPARDLRVELVASAAIAGRVTELSGEPAVGAWVVAVQLTGDAPDAVAQRQVEIDTDDLGEYRLSNLPAGRYAVLARWSPNGALRPSDTASGSLVVVGPGDEAVNVSFVVDARPSPVSLPSPIQNGKGVIRGRVVGPSGRPIVGSMVMASQPGAFLLPAATNAQGRFAITGLRAGAYAVQAASTGYVSRRYGQESVRESGRMVTLRDAETVQGIDIVLPRGSAITGTIVDEGGEPVHGLNVRALQRGYAGGRMVASPVNLPERRTDDRGRYRIYGLGPGTYVLSASMDGNGYAPVYHPGSANIAEASPVPIELGRDAVGIDLMFTPSPAVRVTGTALDSTGRPMKGVVVLVRSRQSRLITADQPRARAGPDGVFVMNDVPPGDYVLQATHLTTADAVAEFGAQLVTITDATAAPLSITTSPGATITGDLVIEGQPELPPSGLSLVAVPSEIDHAPATGDSSRFALLDAGAFRLSGVHGRRRIRLGRAPEDWYLKSVTINGQDATETPFDFGFRAAAYDANVVVSRAGAIIGGRVTDDRARPIGDCPVIVFSTDREKWLGDSRHLRMARSAADGSFLVRALPPGEYLVAAVDATDGTVAAGEWQRPEVLETLSSRASRLTIGEGESRSIALRAIRR